MYYQGSPVPARVRSPGPRVLHSPQRTAGSWTASSSSGWSRGDSARGSSLMSHHTTSGSSSPEALLSRSYETIMADINLHRPIGRSSSAHRSRSPVAAIFAGRASSPRSPHRSVYASRSPRARSPRVPSSSFYRPVGSPVARTIFPTRRTASASPSRGASVAHASVASHLWVVWSSVLRCSDSVSRTGGIASRWCVAAC